MENLAKEYLKPMACLGGRVLAVGYTDRSVQFGNTPQNILVVVITEKEATHREWAYIISQSKTWQQAADKAIAEFGGFSMLLPNGEIYSQNHLGAILTATLYEGGIGEA